MARISAGSTLVNQYAPPFVVSNSVSTNWQLRWNNNLKAFEAFDPAENVIESGFESIEVELFPNVSQSVFVVPWVAESKESLLITINGVKQHSDAYEIVADEDSVTTTVTLDEATTNDDVEIVGLLVTVDGGASIQLFSAIGDNVETDFDLTWIAAGTESLIVTLDGIKQATDTYTLPSSSNDFSTLSFLSAPALDAAIEVIGLVVAGETPASPVNAANLGSGPTIRGLYRDKIFSGANQILRFKSLAEGSNITITANDINPLVATYYTIDAVVPTFAAAPTATGESIVIDLTPDFANGDDLEFLGIAGDGDRISTDIVGDDIVVSFSYGYATTAVTPRVMVAGERILGITALPSAMAVTLPAIASLAVGDTITIKDQIGAAGTFDITITPAGLEEIDGDTNYIISSDYGYVTFYNDGSNFFVIAEG